MCGENTFDTPVFPSPTGSPPRVRGKRSKRIAVAGSDRITPACAGKTLCLKKRYGVAKDHPRVCGENSAVGFSDALKKGSPPRVRGKHDKVRGGAGHVGITPACAGKTTERATRSLSRKDHPRVCGENLPLLGLQLSGVGSPPRVRGKQSSYEHLGIAVRITPACAGKTSHLQRHPAADKDHPRVCGENSCPQIRFCRITGSPPRVRGKLTPLPPDLPAQGITPACAGKT